MNNSSRKVAERLVIVPSSGELQLTCDRLYTQNATTSDEDHGQATLPCSRHQD